MNLKKTLIMALSAALMVAASAMAIGKEKTVVVPKGELKWKDMGIPGVAAAPVSGDMDKGPSRFFLKYPVAFVTPSHHHTTDHYVTLISGSVTHTVGGKD